MKGKSNKGESKYWCFTLNNWTEEEADKIEALREIDGISYIVAGYEIGAEGTPHIQGYVEFEKKKRMTAVKKILSDRCHMEMRRRPADRASNYCKKGDQDKNEWKELHEEGPNFGKNASFWEWGTISEPEQGARKDLRELCEGILSGDKSVDEICVSDPWMFHLYGRTLNKAEDLMMRKLFRTKMTQGIWLHGETGGGKSHAAFKDFHPDTHYVWPNDGKWWDSYKQQEVVIINDFRGEIPYNTLLQLLDKWPMNVARRNREPMPFLSKKIIITSSLPPHAVYNRRQEEDNIAQLLRRIEVIELQKCDRSTPPGNTKAGVADYENDEFMEEIRRKLELLTLGATR